jgi:hypothetical protein
LSSRSAYGAHVYALALDPAGHLFVGGDFTYAGTKLSPFLAQANLRGGVTVADGVFGAWVYSPVTGFSCTFADATIGQDYRIQAAPLLSADGWTVLTNFTYNGPTVIADPAAVGAAARFYRAVSP